MELQKVNNAVKMGAESVSYTHLDVYKRQELLCRVLNDRHFTVPKAFTIRAEALCTAAVSYTHLISGTYSMLLWYIH